MNKTNITRCDFLLEGCGSDCVKEQEYFKEVKEVFDRGELIVYPTETLYALGANPFDEKAINRLFEVKRRPKNMPVSVAVADIKMMKRVAEVNELAKKIYEHFLPGPLTLLLKKKADVPDVLTFGGEKIGIRVPKHPGALRIIDMVGPITATSANLHGHPEPKNLDIALEQLGEEVILYLDCGECEYKGASTIVDVSDSSAKVIREGVISSEELLPLTDSERM
ncbi:MAG: L-threonylcarbamoyladenylate synthase [Thermoplasmata archaeon]